MGKWGGAQARGLVALTLSTYGTTCHLCHHPSADSADHVVPRSAGGRDALANLRPVHWRPCPTCGRRCNQQRGATPLPRHAPAVVADLAFFQPDAAYPSRTNLICECGKDYPCPTIRALDATPTGGES